VIVDLPEATEECLVPHSQVYELLQNVPGYDTLTINSENHTVDLSWEDGHANSIPRTPRLPPMPELKVRAEGT